MGEDFPHSSLSLFFPNVVYMDCDNTNKMTMIKRSTFMQLWAIQEQVTIINLHRPSMANLHCFHVYNGHFGVSFVTLFSNWLILHFEDLYFKILQLKQFRIQFTVFLSMVPVQSVTFRKLLYSARIKTWMSYLVSQYLSLLIRQMGKIIIYISWLL